MLGALARSDFETVGRLGHDMKGAGASFGFQAITDIGAGLEAGGRRMPTPTHRDSGWVNCPPIWITSARTARSPCDSRSPTPRRSRRSAPRWRIEAGKCAPDRPGRGQRPHPRNLSRAARAERAPRGGGARRARGRGAASSASDPMSRSSTSACPAWMATRSPDGCARRSDIRCCSWRCRETCRRAIASGHSPAASTRTLPSRSTSSWWNACWRPSSRPRFPTA